MKMVADREAKAEEERLKKKAAADAAFKAVVEQTEKQNNEEDELRMLRYDNHIAQGHMSRFDCFCKPPFKSKNDAPVMKCLHGR